MKINEFLLILLGMEVKERKNMTYLEEFRNRIVRNDFQSVLKLWEEFCYNNEPDGQELILILKELKNSDLAHKFSKYVERAISLWRELKDPEEIHQVIKLITDIQSSNSPELLNIVYQYLHDKYSNDADFLDKIRIIGIREGREYQGAISHYELLNHLKKGNFVFHSGGWGTCEIIEVSKLREEVVLECDLVIGLKHLSFKNACKTLTPLLNDHFLAQRFGTPDALEKKAKENPSFVIRLLLKDLGPKTAAEIKEELCELVIPENDWNRWWQTARNKLKKDTKIALPKTTKDVFRLRDEEIPHEVHFYQQLEQKPSMKKMITLIYSFLRDFPETLKNKDFKASLEKKLLEVMESSDELPTSQKLQLLFFLQDLKNANSAKQIQSIIENTEEFLTLINEVEVIAFKKKILSLVRKYRSDWNDIFLTLFYSFGQTFLQDYILSELIKIKNTDPLENKLKELLSHPISYPDVFIWYFQKIFSSLKSNFPLSDNEGKKKFLESFFILLDHLSQKADYRELCKKMVHLITDNRYKLIRDIFKIATIDEVKEYLLLATKCSSLSDHDIKIMYSLAEVAHPKLGKERKVSSEEDEDIIWTTQEGLHKIQSRIQILATKEIVENAKEIEEARSHGDLRENAEYKAALERRSHLQAELKLLSDQANQAKIINPDTVKTDTVGFGTIVHCRNNSGDHISYTILGPWDADTEKNIIAQQSKLAQSMKNLSVGNSFKFQEKEYIIEKIENYFTEK